MISANITGVENVAVRYTEIYSILKQEGPFISHRDSLADPLSSFCSPKRKSEIQKGDHKREQRHVYFYH